MLLTENKKSRRKRQSKGNEVVTFISKSNGELGAEEIVLVTVAVVLFLETVLQLHLHVLSDAIGDGGIDTPRVRA